MNHFRAFSLIELLVVMVIISILLLGSISLTVKYSADLQWNRLFNRLEQMVLDVNTYALAGISLGFEEKEEVSELPDMRHLLMMKGEPIVWYLESRALLEDEAAPSSHDRKIVYQEKQDLDVSSMELDQIFLQESQEGGERRSFESVLFTWSNPFARLEFLDADLEFDGKGLKETFVLGEQDEMCESNCFLSLEYVKSGAEGSGIMFDLQKGIYRDFY
jgi:prepilin-type N-terminal cleavage/methylation domain-containing protein